MTFLRAQGAQIVDGHGQPVLLRGMGVGNWLLPEGYMWKFEPPGPQSPREIEALIDDLVGPARAAEFWQGFRDTFITESDIARIAAEGMNHVRLPMNARLLYSDGFEHVDKTISWCREHGLWVVLDLHGAPGGQTGTNIDDSLGTPALFESPRYREQTIELWRTLAGRYRDEPAVAGYDLLNEPLPNDYQHTYAAELGALYRDLTAMIREIDENHLIIYEGSHWATNWSIFTEVWDPNSMLQFHRYWSPPDRPGIQTFLDTRDRLGLPIYMGEGGENNTDWLQTAFQLYEDHEISWNFWPWKKLRTRTSPCSVVPPGGWDDIVDYAADKGPRPAPDAAWRTLRSLLDRFGLTRCEWREDVMSAVLRRVPPTGPLRLPASGFGFRGPGVSYRTFAARPLPGFRPDDQVTILASSDSPAFDHTDGSPRDPADQLPVELGRDEWVAYEFTTTEPADLTVTARLAGADGLASQRSLPSVAVDDIAVPLSAAGTGTTAVAAPGRHVLRVTGTAQATRLARLELTASLGRILVLGTLRSSLIVVACLLLSLVLGPGMKPAHASLGSPDFLKTSGIYFRNNSGTGSIVTLRGTNLGGWLTQEDWMSPLGEFALDRTTWTATASVNGSSAGNALDGDDTTAWGTGAAQQGGEWFQVDMGAPTLVNRIYLDAAGFTGQEPAGYQVLVSSDGSTWENVASGASTAQRQSISFTAQVDRYIRIVQTGTSSSPWSIAEFNAFSDPVLNDSRFTATASVTGTGSSPGNALDGNVNTSWSTGTAQSPGQWFTVDMGTNTQVNKVLLDSGPALVSGYPVSYQIWGSQDDTNWTQYASGMGSGRITTATLWTTEWMRYLKIVETGSGSTPWSIAGIGIYSSLAFDRTGWTITASSTENGGSVHNMTDGNTATRWSDGVPQAGGEWVEADMGAMETFNQIQLDNSTDTNDYPRGYTVQVSPDATTWTQVASGTGYPGATPINFPAVSARYFKITQTGTSSSWWSIDELNAYLNNDDYDMNIDYEHRFGTSTTENLLNTYRSSWIQASDLDNIAATGMNVVRLPIGWKTLLNDDGTWKSDAWTYIDWLVSQAGQRGIYVILDLHTLPGGDCPWESCGREGENPNEFWNNTTYQDWVNNIWQTMAARYAGNPTVAGYDLMNEPLLSYNETSAQIAQKNAYYNRLYNTVRAVDPSHIIFMEAFFGWNNIAPPSTYGWTNVAYELHPYDMPDGLDYNAQSSLVQTQLASVATQQASSTWGVPILYGEYQLYKYDDVWSEWMAGLNALHASWTNWSYKVTGGQNDGGGGYWGLYNSDSNPVPVINNDTSSTVNAKLGTFATSDFQPNTALINDVSKFATDSPWMESTPLPETGWVATASSTESGGSPANAIDWNTSTRWSTGLPQAPGQWFQVDMGSSRLIDQVSWETEANDHWDFPRGYQVQVSADGSTWTTVLTGQGFGWKQALAFPPAYARYVRMTQTGTAAEWWSIAEFHVYGELPLARASWVATASVNSSTAGNAIDGNMSTRWTTGAPQAGGEWFQVDMGQNETFNRLLLDAGASTGDYPRGYQVEVSQGGSTWTTVATGAGSSAAVIVQFPVQVARYVRIVQTGTSGNWWSIAEMNVYGEQDNPRTGWTATASSTEPGGSTANAFDGLLSTRWSSGTAQAPGQWFEVDQGSAQWFNHIVMDSGPSTGDYPRGYIVQVSNDNSTWQTVANGDGTGAWTGVNFPIVDDRYIKITLTESSGNWWSIAEFRSFQA